MISSLILAASSSAKNKIILTDKEDEAKWLYSAIEFWQKRTFLLLRPSEKLYFSPQHDSSRLREFSSQLSRTAFCEESKIIISTVETAFLKFPPKHSFTSRIISLKPSDEVCIEKLSLQLTLAGFAKTRLVQAVGQFAIRGEILDIAISDTKSYRIYFHYSAIDKIKTLDITSQRSIREVEDLVIFPVEDLLLNQESLQNFTTQFNKKLNIAEDIDSYKLLLSQKITRTTRSVWPYLFKTTSSILDLAPNAQIIYNGSIKNKFSLFLTNAQNELSTLQSQTKFYADIEYLVINQETLAELSAKTTSLAKLLSNTGPGSQPRVTNLGAKDQQSLCQSIHDMVTQGQKVLISACETIEEVKEILLSWDLEFSEVDSSSQIKPSRINLCTVDFPSFELEEVVVINSGQILPKTIAQEKPVKQQLTQKTKITHQSLKHYLFELNNFEVGELAVHKDYGIGQFLGLESITVSNITKDYVKLLYANNDKLFVPVENLELIKKFGDGQYPLDRLDAVSWQRRKAKVKSKITELAYALVLSTATRTLQKSEPIAISLQEYEEFLESFPYLDTPDQSKATQDIFQDLAQGKILDRLICGDVGYGKTEIAMRTAFIMLKNDPTSQIAVITPTTVLTRQHFINFKKRFCQFGFTTAQLSRLLPLQEQKLTKQKIAAGELNIVISTIGSITQSTDFKNLKLVVIDEEQQFGVKQKETLKNLRNSCHTLYLSATPIPRTLHMSLIGLKDITIINTPPFEKKAVTSSLVEKTDQILKEAISFELERGGQVLYVVPRQQHLPAVLEKINELLPDTKVATASGSMPPGKLDQVLQDFYAKKLDMLLSTNIIGSGLDIASSNTIIVDNAELFGLAQLYQLRGRVGRGKVQGFCYFLSTQINTETLAAQRLQVIQNNQALGSSFNIASYDMDIRGFGNLLGAEQSGVIREVGVELYQDMVKEEISKIKSHSSEQKTQETKMSLHTSISIPQNYIQDASLRLLVYRKIASLTSDKERDVLLDELNDRFGTVPREVEKLLDIVSLKIVCNKAQALSVDVGPLGAVLKFNQAITDKLSSTHQFKSIKIRADNSIFVNSSEKTLGSVEQIKHITSIVKQLNQLSSNQ